MSKPVEEQLTVTKQFHWEMAHMLSGYNGLCANVHGHSYKMEVEVKTTIDAPHDMVVDFSVLKKVINSVLIGKLDHGFAYDDAVDEREIPSAEARVVKVLRQNNLKLYPIHGRPTAETMVKQFWRTIQTALSDDQETCWMKLQLVRITLWETSTGSATYRGQE